MNPQDIIALLAVSLLTLFNAAFTLVEAALVTVRNARLSQIVTEGGSDAANATQVQVLMREPARVVATVQVGITLAIFAVAGLDAAVLAPHLRPLLVRWHVPHPLSVATIGLLLIAALLTIAIGEIVPRSIALRGPEKIVLALSGALRFFMALFAPLASIALGLSHVLLRPLGLAATFAAPAMTEEELRTLIEQGARSGAIEEDEKERIRRVITFGDTEVRQVMTPRIRIKAGDVSMNLSHLLELVMESGHSRIPVYEGTVDTIIGIVHAKDLLPLLARGETHPDLRAVMRAPLLVPENRLVDDLLDEFRRSRTQMAIIQDEYGGTAGLATIEDLLEELVGEINDEYDSGPASTDAVPLQTLDASTFLVDGRMAINDLNDLLALHVPNEDYDTVGGYVFGLFGHQPEAGETFAEDGLQFTVTRTDGRRVEEVRLHRLEAASPASPASPDTPEERAS